MKTSGLRVIPPREAAGRRALGPRDVVLQIVRYLLAPVIAILIAVVLIQYQGYQSGPTILAGLQYTFGSGQSIARAIAGLIPLIPAAVGITIAFRSGMLMLGAEGQIYAGALTGALVGVYVGPMFPALHQALCLIIAGVVGAALSCLLAWLRLRWGVDIVLSSLLSNYILVGLCTYLAADPFRAPGTDSPSTLPILPSATFANLVPQTQLSWSVFVVLAIVIVAWWVAERSVIGYHWRMAGDSPAFAASVGIDVTRARMTAMAVCGALCAIAGALMVTSLQGRFTSSMAIGVGWTAILLSLMARSRPLFAAGWVIVYALLQATTRGIQLASKVPAELSQIIICAVLVTAAVMPGLIALLRARLGSRPTRRS